MTSSKKHNWRKRWLRGDFEGNSFLKKEKNHTLDKFNCKTSKLEMPKEFIGKTKKGGGYTKNAPREWTEKEIEWCIDLRERGYSLNQIAESIERDILSVSIKMKRLKNLRGRIKISKSL